MVNTTKPGNIQGYIAQFPEGVQVILKEMRSIIRSNVPPEATEKISYGMPTFFLKKNLVHFAAYKSHIGFYPTPSGLAAFKQEISKYRNSKGAVQFPIDQPIPFDLIAKIVRFRVRENLALSS